MATKKVAPTPPAKKTGTNIINWEEQLAADAALSAKMEESTATGSFFGTKSGVLTWNDSPVENNQMATVIVGSILENVSYDGEFDIDNPQPPTCFAFGHDEADMKPHATVVAAGQAVHETCSGCPRNAFGTADKGKGKACRNIRRLAVIPAGKIDGNGKFTPVKKAEELEEAVMGFIKLPVTSVRPYSAFVKQTAAALKRPPHGIFSKIKIVPDAKSQFKVLVEPLGLVPNDLLGAVMSRKDEAALTIEQPYNLEGGDEAPARGKKPAARGAKPTGKAAAKKTGRKF